MAERKTKENNASVATFINAIENETKREDCKKILALMKKITGKKAKMWGDTMIGFGRYHYKYASGREGDLFVVGISPRKQNLVAYIMPGFSKYSALMKKLGKCKHSVSCLYIKKLDDVDLKVLETLITRSVKDMHSKYQCA